MSRFQVLERQNCAAGSSYYVCSSPSFRGCCSVDACQNNGCPDSSASSSPLSSSTSYVSSTATKTSTEARTSSHVSSTPEPQPIASIDSQKPGGKSSATATESSLPSQPTSTSLTNPSNDTVHSKPNIGLIAGLVVAASTIIILVLFLLWIVRRHKKLQEQQGTANMAVHAARDSRFSDFFSRLSLIKLPLTPDADIHAKDQSASPALPKYMPCPATPAPDHTPYLDSTPIYELNSPLSSPGSVELSASNSVRGRPDESSLRERSDPNKPHAMSWSEYHNRDGSGLAARLSNT